MPFMAAAIPYITVAAAGASVLGSIQQGQAASSSAKYNSAVAANNAQIATQNATFAGQEGAVNTATQQQKTRSELGAIKTSQAANGIDVNTGSAVDVRSSAAELGELSAINIRSNAVRQAYGYQTQAASDTAQSQLDKEQAKYASEAGYINAGTTLLSQTSTAYSAGNYDNWLGTKGMNG